MSKKNNIDEFKIKNLIEFIRLVNDHKPPTGKAPIYKNIKIFRGLASKNYLNIPGLGRRDIENLNNNNCIFENKMINKANLRMPDIFYKDKFPVQTLSKLQHYGLPTRLLDFTTNALVALYFATEKKIYNKEEMDGKVIIYYEKNENVYSCYNPIVNAIAEMKEISELTISNLERFNDHLLKQEFWKFNYKADYKIEELVDRIGKPIFFESEMNSERIKRQQGLFLIFPNRIESNNPNGVFKYDKYIISQELSEWNPEYLVKIIIPSKNKRKIRNDLADLGITKSFLFPEPQSICEDIFDEMKGGFLK